MTRVPRLAWADDQAPASLLTRHLQCLEHDGAGYEKLTRSPPGAPRGWHSAPLTPLSGFRCGLDWGRGNSANKGSGRPRRSGRRRRGGDQSEMTWRPLRSTNSACLRPSACGFSLVLSPTEVGPQLSPPTRVDKGRVRADDRGLALAVNKVRESRLTLPLGTCSKKDEALTWSTAVLAPRSHAAPFGATRRLAVISIAACAVS